MQGLFGRNGNPALRLCGIMQKHHRTLADISFFYGRTFGEEWQPYIMVMWHYAKTLRSASGFLEIIFGLVFGKYVIAQTFSYQLFEDPIKTEVTMFFFFIFFIL